MKQYIDMIGFLRLSRYVEPRECDIQGLDNRPSSNIWDLFGRLWVGFKVKYLSLM